VACPVDEGGLAGRAGIPVIVAELSDVPRMFIARNEIVYATPLTNGVVPSVDRYSITKGLVIMSGLGRHQFVPSVEYSYPSMDSPPLSPGGEKETLSDELPGVTEFTVGGPDNVDAVAAVDRGEATHGKDPYARIFT
jgi:hypothetical protein